jgi:glycerol-3-phosphate O-acyltransferase
MDTVGKRSMYYGMNSLVNTRANAFMGKVTSLFFKSILFDGESLQTLREYQGKGKIAFVSYQSANTPLLILVNLLRENGLPAPVRALDFTPNLFQMMANMAHNVSVLAGRLGGRGPKVQTVSEADMVLGLLRADKPLILSILSRKLFIRRYIEIKSDTLQYLIEAQKQIEEPIFVFPEILFWNQNPERTRELVTSRATIDRGFFSGLFTLFKSSTPAFMRVSRPINLKEEIAKSTTDDPKTMGRMLRNRLLEIYTQEKRTVLGPVIKSQHEIMEKVLYHKNVLDEIRTLHRDDHTPERKLRKKAYRYFREIAADFSITMIKWFHRSVRYMFTRIFDGIYYNTDDIKRVREAAQRAPLILVPSHKSHMDYLIVSSIFYENKLIPPHIVAGSNLTFFPMGPVFRRSGAFFMRRSFRGLKLYPTVFKQYIKTLISEGYSIEFFIEGGRSRTGKIMLPKMGILKYLIDAIDEGYNRDMIFVPITISYDRILEESSYHMELKGREKEKESTSNFVKSSSLLRRKYGKVYLSFNEPFSYREYRDRLGEGEDLTDSLGEFIGKRISEIVMATPFSVASAAMLQSSASGFTRDMLKERIAVLRDYLAFAGVRMSEDLAAAASADAIIDYVLESYLQDSIVYEPVAGVSSGGTREVLGGLYTLNDNERSRITFYKNSILHFQLPVTYLAVPLLCLSGAEGMDEKTAASAFEDLEDLFSIEFVYSEAIRDTAASMGRSLEFLSGRSVVALSGGNIRVQDEKRSELVLFAKGIQDMLESYLVVLDCVAGLTKHMNKRELIVEVRKNGIRLYHLGEVKFTEALSMPTYDNAIAKLKEIGAIEMTHSGKKQTDVQILDAEKVRDMKARVEKYLRPLQKL